MKGITMFEHCNTATASRHLPSGSPICSLTLSLLLLKVCLIRGDHHISQSSLVSGIVIWGLLFSGEVGGSIWYAPSYLLGVFILFGIASYLGTYLVSTYFRRGTFGVAVGIHLLLTLLYLGAYVMNQYLGPLNTRQDSMCSPISTLSQF